jgi:succinoglycan biosynthesis protein ExoA
LPPPRVDVLVSTFNEEHYVERCLAAVLAQDYPREALRVVLVDGGSTDGTVERARAASAGDPRVTIVADGVRRNLPAALNVGLEACTGELVAKVDAHGWPEPDFIRRGVEVLQASGDDVACVGGRPEQEGETAFGKALAVARTSRFGVGGSGYAGTASRERVDTVQCGMYRRNALAEVGRFDPDMNFGEDDELNWRLRQGGYAVVLDTSIRFHYITRPDWGSAYRQYRNYGESRVRVTRAHPGFLRAYHLAPAAAAAGAGLLAVAAPWSRAARRALLGGAALYAVGAAGAAAQASAGTQASAAQVARAFTALHLGYGVGMLRELARSARP